MAAESCLWRADELRLGSAFTAVGRTILRAKKHPCFKILL
jgi:hypothetical protein